MRNDVAEAREIDLVRAHDGAQHRLDGENDCEEGVLVGFGEVGHLRGMPVQDHPAKAGVVHILHGNHARERIAPENGASGRLAQLTGRDCQLFHAGGSGAPRPFAAP